MTPQQHLERAEQLLETVKELRETWDSSTSLALVLEAVAHSTIAIGDLLGAPHSGPAAAAVPGG